jgi:hypothetical protein
VEKKLGKQTKRKITKKKNRDVFVYVIPALVDRRPESSSTFFPLQKFPNFFIGLDFQKLHILYFLFCIIILDLFIIRLQIFSERIPFEKRARPSSTHDRIFEFSN